MSLTFKQRVIEKIEALTYLNHRRKRLYWSKRQGNLARKHYDYYDKKIKQFEKRNRTA